LEQRPQKENVSTFLLEDAIRQYWCVGKIIVDNGEFDAKKAHEFFWANWG